MPNPYGYLGAAGAASAGVQGAEALAKLLGDQERQRMGWDELGIRREALAGEERGREQRYELGLKEVEQRDMASRLAAAAEAAKYGQYSGLADITGQPATSFRHYEAPPTNLEGLLTRALDPSRPGYVAPGQEDVPYQDFPRAATPRVEYPPHVQGIIKAMAEVESGRAFRPWNAPTPEHQYITDLVAQEKAGTISEEDKKRLANWRDIQTGLKGKVAPVTGPKVGSPAGIVSYYTAKIAAGETLDEAEQTALAAGLANLRAGAVTAGTRAVTEPAKVEVDREAKWRDDWRAGIAAANKIVSDEYDPKRKDAAISRAHASLQALAQSAPTPQRRAEADDFVKRWLASQNVKPLGKGGRRF